MIKREAVVIGAGPAGLSAAIEAAKRDADVLLIDESLKAGGQLFKQIHKFFGSSAHRSGIRGIDIGKELLEEAKKYGVEIWLNCVATGLFKEKKIAVEKSLDNQNKTAEIIKAEKIVIATGASENAIAFEGWTLPGVMGAGAAQTMANIHNVLPGEKILMIGSGNVGLIVSYQLLQAGAEVVGVLEAAPEIGGYGVHAAKIVRAGVPIHTSTTIVEARGDEKNGVKEAVVCDVDDCWQPIKGQEKIYEVDTITIAAGLKPLMELARMHGCRCDFIPQLGGWLPLHDKNMETTYPGIYVAGDSAGVEEANTALEEGRLAGVAIAESLGYIHSNKASSIKNEIWNRVDGLRLGPFGESRLEAKEKIIKTFQ
ncbi:MAG: FAD-dependent oxidoreductase [Candidatus Cloacimonetes bacterium]|nr:FAD-dependent oxidoreductase [Candidatus Cloacimonadota bacterium]